MSKWLDGVIIVAMAALLALFAFTANGLGIFESMENTTLDLLLRWRAEKFTPSENIVLLSMDHATLAYARQHPELGIQSRILPRRYLAKITDYLREQGVRAVVFDVEFKLPQSPQDDEALHNAFARFPRNRLFLAARADTPLDDVYPYYQRPTMVPIKTLSLPLIGDLTLDARQQDQPRNGEAFARDLATLQNGVITPALLAADARLKGQIARLAGESGLVSPLAAQLTRAFVDTPALATFSPDALARLQADSLNAGVVNAQSPGYAYSRLQQESLQDLLYEAYENDLCLRENYWQYYGQQNPYLDFLRRQSLPIHTPPRLPPEIRRKLVYCFTDNLQTQYQLPHAQLGVTNVLYERDSFERTAPALKKLYDGSYHAYLGIRPALSLLAPRRIAYDGQTLTIDERRIPLLQHQNILINWRSPDGLPPRLLSHAYMERRLLWDDLAPVARLNAALPPDAQLRHYALTRWGLLPRWSEAALSPTTMLDGWAQLSPQAGAFFASRPSAPLARLFQGALGSFATLSNLRLTHIETQSALGNAHLYRKISVSEILRQLAPIRAGQAAEPLYRLHGAADSGEFSFKDKIVIYGDTMDDIHRTPMGRVFGPEVVATSLDMTLNDRQFVGFSPGWVCVILAALVCIPLVWVCLRQEGLPMVMLIALFIVSSYATGVITYFLNTQDAIVYYTYILGPTLILFLALIAALVYRHVVQNREKRMLTHAFSRYVSPQLMTAILNDPAKVMDNLKGGKKELTVLFADLRNFTSTFEDEDPEKMVAQLNEYFDAMTNIILEHQGTYDKYMGDAIMAFFGAPVAFDDHALKACQAAMRMCEALDALNAKWVAEGKTELGIGVGLSTGEMFVGNFGSQRIKNFTVMGSAVNLGARLETFTRQAGVNVVISERTQEQARDSICVSPLGEIRVKGFSAPVQAFGLLEAPPSS